MTNKQNASKNRGNKNSYITILSKVFEKDNIFVCYNDKKEPISPITLKKVDCTNKNNLTSINEALLSSDRHDLGIGIVLGKTNKWNLCGIDIDECIDEKGNISNQAQEIINLFDSYTEISISGKGVHILFFATKKGNRCKNNKLNWCKCIEMYDSNRYFALSGNTINNKSIEIRQEQADTTYNKFFNNSYNQAKSIEIVPIKILSKEKEKEEEYQKHFQYALSVDSRLNDYWNGIRPTNDESCNDNGFISKLAYWLNNYDLIKIFFLESPYFEQKDQKHKDKCLKRKDYLHRTIMKVLGGQYGQLSTNI